MDFGGEDVCVCADGAKAMTGRHSGVVTRVQAVAPNSTRVHCSIHREALAAKGMPDSLKNVLDTTVKMVNYVKARPLNSYVFSALCNYMGSEHVTLLLVIKGQSIDTSFRIERRA